MEDRTFLVLLVAVTLAFGWVLLPFYGAIFWGVVLAIVFAPLFRRVLPRVRQSRNVSALITLAVILLLVILPLALISAALVNEGTLLYRNVQSGEISISAYMAELAPMVPDWLMRLLDRVGLGDFAALQQKAADSATAGTRLLATRLFDIGQNTLDFVISFGVSLYLTFFLLRDGSGLARRIWDAIPLDAQSKLRFFTMFATVIRATIKGNILVAVVQGALGGIAFWYLGVHGAVLWGTLMAFMSLLPAIGAALIWLPVAIYFLLTGAMWKGIGLLLWGTLVIGVVDNVLRPILVGKDIKMPDYLVLISTLGGLAIFGLNGFVLGPVIAALFLSAWQIFTTARHEEKV